jgi:4-azaleucine resistance transporter AzlC
MTAQTKLALEGARDSLALVLGAIPFGIIFGALAARNGLSLAAAMGMSLFVFAGSAQFIALGLVAAGAALPVILLTTFVVNLRHLLYAATLTPRMRSLPRGQKALSAFLLTDESFAVLASRIAKEGSGPRLTDAELGSYYLGSAIFMYAEWQLSTLIGALFGNLIPGVATWGLDFAMPVAFIGMTAPYLRSLPTALAAASAGAISLAASGLPNKLGLMAAALGGIAVGSAVDAIKRKGAPK